MTRSLRRLFERNLIIFFWLVAATLWYVVISGLRPGAGPCAILMTCAAGVATYSYRIGGRR